MRRYDYGPQPSSSVLKRTTARGCAGRTVHSSYSSCLSNSWNSNCSWDPTRSANFQGHRSGVALEAWSVGITPHLVSMQYAVCSCIVSSVGAFICSSIQIQTRAWHIPSFRQTVANCKLKPSHNHWCRNRPVISRAVRVRTHGFT